MKKAPATSGARRSAAAGTPEQGLGELLRQLRAERNLSVRTLATRAGFSPSFVSQVELNHASPSIASLERLAAALGVTLGDFFREPAVSGPAITRSGKRRPLTSWWSRARIEPLTPMGAGQPFEAMMITIAAGGSSGTRPHAHPGHQFAIVFDGELRLTLGDEVQILARGDGATFDAATPHRWENPGKQPARLVIVSSRFIR
jgi:XRE family transcriptional regulator, regulator of sulfur utilization